MPEKSSTHQPEDIPTYTGEFKEGEGGKADLKPDVIKEIKIRPYIRKAGGFTKGLTDEQINAAIVLLKDRGESDVDIQHDLDLLRKGVRTGTERLGWDPAIRVPGMEATEAMARPVLKDSQLLRQITIQQGAQIKAMAEQLSALADKLAELTGGKPAEERIADVEVAVAEKLAGIGVDAKKATDEIEANATIKAKDKKKKS